MLLAIGASVSTWWYVYLRWNGLCCLFGGDVLSTWYTLGPALSRERGGEVR